MAKAIKGVVAVIGAVAGVLAVIPSPIQPIAAIVAAAGAVASTALNIMFPAKPKSSSMGSQTAFRLDPQAGIPYVIGRTCFGGLGVHRDTWGTDNQYHGIVIAWSGGGPIGAIESFQVDNSPVAFGGGGAAVGGFAGFMWLNTQLGACPSPALASPVGGFPGWGANQKLSGYAAGVWVTMFDKKGKKYAAGLPKTSAVLRGPKCYDPRLDSTYPGGAGACRAGDESTYVESQNPWIQAITWALGRWQNGLKVLGVGMAAMSINMASFVDAANVADANNWKAGGVVSSVDDKWEVLKMLAQAGGGECVRLGGKLSAFVNAPRVSIATIETSDLVGPAKIATSQFMRSRINGVVPIIRLETHGWEQVPAKPVRWDPYVVEDGGRRTVETELVLVQQLQQGAQLAGYEIVNAREFGPIDLQLKLRWLGLEPGDMVTLNIPTAGLANQKCLSLARSLDPTTGNVAISFRSETDAKHDLALGRTTTVPASPSLTPIDLSVVAAPGALAWAVAPAVITGPDGGSFPILRARGATDNPNASHVVFEYRPVVAPVGPMPGAPAIGDVAVDATGSQFVWEAPGAWARVWIMQATQDAGVTEQEFPAVTPLTQYQIAVSYVSRGVLGARRVLGPVTTAELIGSGKLWIQSTPPSRDESTAGDIWIDDAGFYWVRREEVYLSVAGNRLMVAGNLITMTWTPADSQPIINQVGSALDVALAASAAAAALATNAQATADGKINSFYQDNPPAGQGEAEGDIWFDTNDGKKQYIRQGGLWVSAQDTAIGAALDAAAAADAKADGKVVTFISESAPTAEGVGDLWFKLSTGELRRWSGAAWSDPLVDLTALGQVTVIMPPNFTLGRDRDAQVKPDQLPASVSPVIKRGETSIKLSNSVSYAVVGSGGLAGKVSVDDTNGSPTKGDITFANTITTAGELRLTVTVSGVAYGPFTMALVTVDDPPPINNGAAGGSDSTLESVSTGADEVMSSQDAGDPVLDVVIGAGQTLKAVVNISYTKGGGLALIQGLAQYSLDGVTWTDFPEGRKNGTEAGKYTYVEAGEVFTQTFVGDLSMLWQKSGLAAGTYKVRLLGKRVGAVGTLVPSGGYFTSSRV